MHEVLLISYYTYTNYTCAEEVKARQLHFMGTMLLNKGHNFVGEYSTGVCY